MAAEFAMVVPLLLVFSFGIIEFGRAMWMRNTMQSVVENAARCYALDREELTTRPCSTQANVESYAATAANNAGVDSLTASNFEASSPACGRRVTATYQFQAIVPIVPLNVTLTANACRAATPTI
ncbi:TadE/TadG family type IV pilus assembly protein [Sphingopyxis bauzanensis]|nr:TadE family protein [Sphingopyxis bauzanensis]